MPKLSGVTQVTPLFPLYNESPQIGFLVIEPRYSVPVYVEIPRLHSPGVISLKLPGDVIFGPLAIFKPILGKLTEGMLIHVHHGCSVWLK